jgi:hypothetical protein
MGKGEVGGGRRRRRRGRRRRSMQRWLSGERRRW